MKLTDKFLCFRLHRGSQIVPKKYLIVGSSFVTWNTDPYLIKSIRHANCYRLGIHLTCAEITIHSWKKCFLKELPFCSSLGLDCPTYKFSNLGSQSLPSFRWNRYSSLKISTIAYKQITDFNEAHRCSFFNKPLYGDKFRLRPILKTWQELLYNLPIFLILLRIAKNKENMTD